MELKDKKFKFMNSIYTIKFVDRIPTIEEDGSTYFGQFNADKKEILIGTKTIEGKSYPEKQIKNTLRHELMHMIMFEGQYLASYSDEPQIEWLAKSIGILLEKNIL